MNPFDLKGKTAIITGGNDGIGRGIATALAMAGASVCIAGRNEEKNERILHEVEKLGARCIVSRCDVNVAVDIAATIAVTQETFGGLDILVNNAGIATLNAPEQMTDDEWDSVL